MTISKLFLITVVTMMIAGCGSKLPECGDAEALNLVKKVISDDSEKNGVRIEVSQIVLAGVETKAKDDKLKKNQCSANLVVSFKPETSLILQNFASPDIRRDFFVGAAAEGAIQFSVDQALSFYKIPGVDPQLGDNPFLVGFVSTFFDSVANAFLDEVKQAGLSIENDEKVSQDEKLQYVVRRSEDKSNDTDYLVEVDLPSSVMNVMNSAAGLQIAVEKGREVIAAAKARAK